MSIPKKALGGLELDVLALGTWKMGGSKKRSEDNDDQRDIAGIKNAYKLGMRRFDTAEIYAAGYSETLLGEALADINRDEVCITSKVFWSNLSYDGVLESCQKSLERLQMDYLDLYLIHGPSDLVPIEETMKAMNELKSQGKIKHIGVANYNVDRLKAAQAVCDSKIVLNQVHYNLIFREPELKGVLDFCRKTNVFIEAWRPIQEGSLCNSGIQILDEMAAKYNKTPGQISLQWLIAQEGIITLFKSSNLDHIKENLGAVSFEMGAADIEKLSKEFPIQTDRSNAVQLT